MQELRFVAVSEDGSYAILAVPGRSGRYVLPIDERLRAIANGQTSRLAQYEIEVESPLRPKEIQARIRAGETAEEIADAAGIPLERVRWFEGPVLAERAYIATQAQAASVRRAGDSGPGPRLGDIVPARLTASGADPEDAQWDSRKRGDGNWQVTLSFPSSGRVHLAEWVFDPRRRHAMPDDDNAARLSLPESELPQEPVAMPGEATVTPLAPRLGAAAGIGGGGGIGIGGPGGFAGGGSGAGGRSFRPERSVIPDRSLGADRTLADRSPAAERPPVLRDPIPESAPYFDQMPDTAAFRAPIPERPVPPWPVIFEDPAPAAILDDPEPTAFDWRLEVAQVSASTQAPADTPATALPQPPEARPVETPPSAEVSHAQGPVTTAAPEPVKEPVTAAVQEPVTAAAVRRQEPGAQAEPVTVAAAAEATAPQEATAPIATAPAAEVPAASNAATIDQAEPAADATEPAAEQTADDQSARPRPGSKKNAKGRRSSVPSWDEIMLGSSRQRE